MIDAAEQAPRRARVLIVDDERQNRRLLEVMLAPENLSLQTASSGEEALEMVSMEAPDLIVLDIMMPGMDGYQVMAHLKANATTKNIPVVIVTALFDQRARIQGLGAGAEDFLNKPVDRMELCVRVRNLLHRKFAEEELGQIRDEQLRFKDEFLSHVSHELRAPLTAIKQFSSILLNGLAGELNAEQREYQQIVLRNVSQLQSMIDDLLEVTRLDAGKLTITPERTSIADVIRDALDTLQGAAGAKEITLSAQVPAEILSVHADPMRLRQILINLLDNAVKFTPSGGAVQVTVRSHPVDPSLWQFEVSDTGCGIAPEASGRIFDRLYQMAALTDSSRKGLGLGLYICKELVTRQGGDIWLTHPEHQGTTIAFTMPALSPSDEQPDDSEHDCIPEENSDNLTSTQGCTI